MPTSIDPQPGENEFECARCGAYFHYELNSLPQLRRQLVRARG